MYSPYLTDSIITTFTIRQTPLNLPETISISIFIRKIDILSDSKLSELSIRRIEGSYFHQIYADRKKNFFFRFKDLFSFIFHLRNVQNDSVFISISLFCVNIEHTSCVLVYETFIRVDTKIILRNIVHTIIKKSLTIHRLYIYERFVLQLKFIHILHIKFTCAILDLISCISLYFSLAVLLY